jgi:hypothetical protein
VQRFVLKSADVEFTSFKGDEQFHIVFGKEVETLVGTLVSDDSLGNFFQITNASAEIIKYG